MPLTNPQQMLLEAVRCALNDQMVSWQSASEADLKAMMGLATRQKLLPLVTEAVYCSPACAAWAAMPAYKSQARRQVALQAVRTGAFLRLQGNLQQAGLHPVTVKGVLCRGLYRQGDHRISADEDILVPAQEFDAACVVLKEQGFLPDGSTDGSPEELGWQSADKLLTVELHRCLFPSGSDAGGDFNRFFPADAPVEPYSVEGGRAVVNGLAPHDHLLYLILHAFKHFIHSGFGLRQTADIGLWARAFASRIDWEKLYSQLAECRAERFAYAVFCVAKQHLGIEFDLPGSWQQLNVDEMPLLCDLLSGTLYGAENATGQHAGAVVRSTVEADRQGKKNSLIKTAFPPAKDMQARFPQLKSRPWLLPWYWGVRLANYGKESAASSGAASEAVRMAKARTELLKKYGIL